VAYPPAHHGRPRLVGPTVSLAAGLCWAGTAALSLVDAARRWAPACGAAATALSLILVVIWVLGRRLVAVTVRGISMEPAFQDGDRVLVRRGRTPSSGQVVVAEHPGLGHGWHRPPVGPAAGAGAIAGRTWMIKRVAAVPGEPVPRDRVPVLADVPEERVPPGKLVLLGDNSAASSDSRQRGYFPAERVLGVVVRPLQAVDSRARRNEAAISASASTRPAQVAPSTDLPGSRSL
jgi:signal peptidase I